MVGPGFQLIDRFSTERVATALADTPVVMLIGPRQCGKTTLVRQFVDKEREYVTLDNDTVLEAARSDPAGFIRGFDLVTIDEVQRAPELLRAIKLSVDSDRRAGRFLLTGSANILTLPQVSESLAGRMEIVNLMPISRAEIAGKKTSLLEDGFHRTISQARPSYDRRRACACRVGWRLSRNATAPEFPPPSDLGTRLREGNRTKGCTGYCGG